MININDIKNRDKAAFNDFVIETYEEVYRLIFRFLKVDADVEDIIQDVYLTVYKNIDGFKGNSDIKTWLYRIAVNKSLNFLKKESRLKTFSTIESNAENEEVDMVSNISSDRNYEADFEMESKQLKEMLDTAINALPDRQKSVFIMFHYEGFSYQKIADILETSVSSVESLMFRAKLALKKNLIIFYKKNYL